MLTVRDWSGGYEIWSGRQMSAGSAAKHNKDSLLHDSQRRNTASPLKDEPALTS
jgi:hypothetical protein